MRFSGSITDIDGLVVGHCSDEKNKTGCTVVIAKEGAVAGVSVRGAAPGTRETDLLNPENSVEKIHAVLLSGGSAFGLAAADGVMQWLYEHKIGLDTGFDLVPIVTAAILFDLNYGSATVKPDKQFGFTACENASEKPVEQGSIGAGTGATVGKLLGFEHFSKGGIGSATITLPNGVKVSALVAVNAAGDVIDCRDGQIIAGAKDENGHFFNIQKSLIEGKSLKGQIGTNTTIGVIATNAKLTKAQANRLANTAHDGLAWSIRPVHTPFDGDTLFALSCGDIEVDMTILTAAATEAVAKAVYNAVTVE